LATANVHVDTSSLGYGVGDPVKVIATGADAGTVLAIDTISGNTITALNGQDMIYPSTTLELSFTPGWFRNINEPFTQGNVAQQVLVVYRPSLAAYPTYTVPVNVSDAT
jgi:hypothetical protein